MRIEFQYFSRENVLLENVFFFFLHDLKFPCVLIDSKSNFLA